MHKCKGAAVQVCTRARLHKMTCAGVRDHHNWGYPLLSASSIAALRRWTAWKYSIAACRIRCVSRLVRALRSFSKRIATSRFAFSKFLKCNSEIILRYGLPPDHASTTEIVRAEFDGHRVACTEDDPISAHVPAEIGVDFVVLVVL